MDVYKIGIPLYPKCAKLDIPNPVPRQQKMAMLRSHPLPTSPNPIARNKVAVGIKTKQDQLGFYKSITKKRLAFKGG